ncbi:hypothetical protein [Bordetella pertussis]|uniref:hypothetical protein n=1 Tax=Bordetella pertussis TaxID=520 RepID=UPI0013967234|nr:hypothetical protein [Bordetella pertussis]
MNWGGGDFQFLKSGSDEPCIQPIESSQLLHVVRDASATRRCAVTRAQRSRTADALTAHRRSSCWRWRAGLAVNCQ